MSNLNVAETSGLVSGIKSGFMKQFCPDDGMIMDMISKAIASNDIVRLTEMLRKKSTLVCLEDGEFATLSVEIAMLNEQEDIALLLLEVLRSGPTSAAKYMSIRKQLLLATVHNCQGDFACRKSVTGALIHGRGDDMTTTRESVLDFSELQPREHPISVAVLNEDRSMMCILFRHQSSFSMESIMFAYCLAFDLDLADMVDFFYFGKDGGFVDEPHHIVKAFKESKYRVMTMLLRKRRKNRRGLTRIEAWMILDYVSPENDDVTRTRIFLQEHNEMFTFGLGSDIRCFDGSFMNTWYRIAVRKGIDGTALVIAEWKRQHDPEIENELEIVREQLHYESAQEALVQANFSLSDRILRTRQIVAHNMHDVDPLMLSPYAAENNVSSFSSCKSDFSSCGSETDEEMEIPCNMPEIVRYNTFTEKPLLFGRQRSIDFALDYDRASNCVVAANNLLVEAQQALNVAQREPKQQPTRVGSKKRLNVAKECLAAATSLALEAGHAKKVAYAAEVNNR